jgi:hypothetical protein
MRKRNLKKLDKWSAVVGLLVVVNVLLVYFVVRGSFFATEHANAKDQPQYSPEIITIKQTQNEKERELAYRHLLDRVGAVEAQEELQKSGLPYDGNSHLLNHIAGFWIYEKYGNTGIGYCRDYFLSSCYHGFLIQFIAKNGIDKLDVVMDSCWKRGVSPAQQCAHAVGHGLLAWDGYKNLPQALSDCDRVATISENFPSYNCYDGVFMENHWALHDGGKPSVDRWFDPSDPTYPCYDSRIGEKFRKACWSNQPQMAYREIFQGDLQKTSDLCLSVTNDEYQVTCFDSVARQIQPMTNSNPYMVYTYCNKMPDGWQTPCINSIANAYFSQGDSVLPFTLCDMAPKADQEACYSMLEQRIFIYETNANNRIEECKRLPSQMRSPACVQLIADSSR